MEVTSGIDWSRIPESTTVAEPGLRQKDSTGFDEQSGFRRVGGRQPLPLVRQAERP
jgi:hypothetical protein